MGQESELYRLERFVEKLLTRFSELKEHNTKLKQQLQERDQTVEELRSSLSSQQSERGEISERLGKIVSQIEKWEQSLDDDDPEPESDVVEDHDKEEQFFIEEDPGPNEITTAEVIEEGKPTEEERRVQHNLFSVTQSRE